MPMGLTRRRVGAWLDIVRGSTQYRGVFAGRLPRLIVLILWQSLNMTRALVFPGQGAQCVGMGQDLAQTFPVARDVYEEVDDALGEKLSSLMAEGLRIPSPSQKTRNRP